MLVSKSKRDSKHTNKAATPIAGGKTVVAKVGSVSPKAIAAQSLHKPHRVKAAVGRKAANARNTKSSVTPISPTEPTAKDVAEREEVARNFFNPTAAAAARASFLARKQSGSVNGQ